MSFISRLKDHGQNVRGWRSGRKLVVFESDDWGASRMPGQAAYDAMSRSRSGIRLSHYDAIDCLESAEDLQALAAVLSSVADSEGRPARFTINMVMGNPDFEAIRSCDFEEFVHEPFHVTYERNHGSDLRSVWASMVDAGLVRHQFHAREHLNAPFWMADLRSGNAATREAFEHGFYGLKCMTGRTDRSDYLAAYDPATESELPEYRAILDDGLRMFAEEFNSPSLTMVPCNYVWPQSLDETLASVGTRCLQGARVEFRVKPGPNGSETRRVRRFQGHRRPSGLRDLVRNVTFEPYLGDSLDHVTRAMQQIRIAFLWNKPAVISTHRINYVGGMRADLRDDHLNSLRELLGQLTKRWPQVEFRSSDELARMVSAT